MLMLTDVGEIREFGTGIGIELGCGSGPQGTIMIYGGPWWQHGRGAVCSRQDGVKAVECQ